MQEVNTNTMMKTLRKYSDNNFFWHILITLIFLIIYTSTVASTPHTYDSAKFQFIGKVLGTPHPTGYPTYVILNFIFVHLCPLGTLAWKANFLSAILTITALNLAFRTIIILDIKKYFAFISTVILGLTRELWKQSVTAEVYSLHLFFVSIVIYLLLKWHTEKDDKYFFYATLFYALSFGNHMTSITLLPALIYLVLVTDIKAFINKKKVLWVIFVVVLGLFQYSYLFWRYYNPSTRFIEGRTPDLSSFLFFITGENWKAEMFGFSIWELITERLPAFFHEIMIDFFYLAFILSIIGIFILKKKKINTFLLLCFAGNFFFVLNYNIVDIKNYYLPNYFILSIYLAVGMKFCAEKFLKNKKKYKRVLITFMVVTFIFFIINFDYINNLFLKGNSEIPGEVKAYLKTVKENAIIISPDYGYSTVFWYYLLGEDLQKSNRIYLVHHFNVEEVKNYLYREKPIYLYEERRYTPLNLDVYVFDLDLKNQIQNSGLKAEYIGGNLYRVLK